jgi:phage protein D
MSEKPFSSVIDVKVNYVSLQSDIIDNLVDVWVDLGSGVPGAFQLTFRDGPKPAILGQAHIKIGSKIKLAPVADGKGAQDTLLTGEVTGLETDFDGRGTFTVVRGYDYGHRMLRRRRVKSYTKMPASAIVLDVVKDSGIMVGKIEPTVPPLEFVAQDNITDWDFVARLADQNEKVMYLDSDGRFHFATRDRALLAPPDGIDSDKSQFVLSALDDGVRYRMAVTSADQVPEVEVRGYDVTTKLDLKSTQKTISNPAIDIGEEPGKIAREFLSSTLVETGIPYDELPQVKRAADALSDDVTSSFAEIELNVRGNPKLRPDVPVRIEDFGEPFDGKYTITGVRHLFEDGEPYRTRVTVSGRQSRSLYGLASGGAAAAPRLPSVANALVTDIKDPLYQGRVKLRFPWLDDHYISDWTRVVQYGGVDGGSIFPLDVKDEVLVSFDRGALDHPFVIGGLYNGRDEPRRDDVDLHDRLKGQGTRHTLADREFNRLDLLSEQTGNRQAGVRLTTGDNDLVINLDRTHTKIIVDSKGDVSITGSKSVHVEAGTDLTLKAKGALNLNAGGALNIDAGGNVAINSAALTASPKGAMNLISEGEGLIKATVLTLNSTTSLALTGPEGMITSNGKPVI